MKTSLNPDDVIRYVCQEYDVTYSQIKFTSLRSDLVEARRVICYLLHGQMQYSTTRVGEMISRDHSTVVYHSHKAKDYIQTDPVFAARLLKITTAIDNHNNSAMQQYLTFAHNQCILLRATTEATPTQAVATAIEFVKENNIKEAELDYRGYLFDIEPTSDLSQKIADYNYYTQQKTVKATINGRVFDMPCEQAKKVLRLQKMIKG